MTIGELMTLFPADAPIQINVITGPGSLTFIPSPGFYQQHPKIARNVDQITVTHLNIEVEEHDGERFLLLIINEAPSP